MAGGGTLVLGGGDWSPEAPCLGGRSMGQEGWTALYLDTLIRENLVSGPGERAALSPGHQVRAEGLAHSSCLVPCPVTRPCCQTPSAWQ